MSLFFTKQFTKWQGGISSISISASVTANYIKDKPFRKQC